MLIPTYEFKPGEDDKSPMERIINKREEITTQFDLMSVYRHIAALNKKIADSEQMIKICEEEKIAYNNELAIIEKALNIKKLDEEFRDKQLKATYAPEESESNKKPDTKPEKSKK